MPTALFTVKATITPDREDRLEYVTVYGFESEDTLQRFLASEQSAFLRAEYDPHFGGVSDRRRATDVQVWP